MENKNIEDLTVEELQELATNLLKEYREEQDELEYANDEFEEALIEENLDVFRRQIRQTKARIRELQAQV
jgi:polyhydroxyalkanoate synthesis regulator phasin